MKKALLIAPTAKFHTLFNVNNIFALQKLGYTVFAGANFDTTQRENYHNDLIKKRLVELKVTPLNIPFARKSLVINISSIRSIRKLLRDEYDLIHVHTETGGFVFAISTILCRKKAVYVYTPHGTSFYKGSSLLSWILFYPVEKWISKKMDLNLSMNDEEKLFFDKCSKDKSHFVHGIGLDIDSIHASKKYNRSEINQLFGVNERSFLIVSVGELCRRKNHEVVLKAIARMDNDNVSYLICGTGNLENELKEKCLKLGIEKKVFFVGYRNDVYSIVSACDVFAFPSIYEGLPVSIMEAMALSKAVVCSDIRGNRELIDNGKGGFLVSNKPEVYAESFNMLMNNKDSIALFGKYNADKVKQYSSSVVVNELYESYKSERKK